MSRLNWSVLCAVFTVCTILSSLFASQLVSAQRQAGPSQQGTPSIHVGSAAVDPGSTVDIRINAKDIPAEGTLGQGIGAIDLVITYDSSVVQLTPGDVSQGERDPTLFGANVTDGQIKLIALWTSGSGAGDFLLATLRVSAVGTPGDQIPLTLSINTIVNPDGDPIVVQVGNGSIAITGQAPEAADDSYSVDEDRILDVDANSGVLANDSDPDDDTLTALLVRRPPNGIVDLHPDGSFIYVPGINFNGTDSFTYKASDGFLDSNTATVTIIVRPVNDPPVTRNDRYSVDEDGVLEVDDDTGVLVNDSDADGDPLTAVLIRDPSNGILSLDSDGSFKYFPDADFSGTDTFTYQANDGELDSNTATVTLTVTPRIGAPVTPPSDVPVTPRNDAPVAVSDAYTVGEGDTLTVSAPGVLANDSDPDDDTLTVVPSGEPSHGILTLAPDGSFTYVHDGSETTSDSFTYVANDGELESIPAAVIITVSAVNDPPVAANDRYSVDEGGILGVDTDSGVLANDSDPDDDLLAAVLVREPSNGTLTFDPGGSFTYVPDVDFRGADITYRANDGELESNTAAVTITVAPGHAPVAVNDSYGVDEGDTLTLASPGVLANDSDPDGDPLTAALVSEPSNGILILSRDGSFTYVHDGSETTNDSFTYVANDGFRDSNMASVSITVNAVNDPPVAVNDSYRVDANGTLDVDNDTGVLANDRDPDDDPLTAVLVSEPSNGTVTLDPDGSFSYLPDANFDGTDTFTYQANDSELDSNTATVTVTIEVVELPEPLSVATIGPFSMLAEDKEQTTQVGDQFNIFVAIAMPVTGSVSSLQFSLEFDGNLLEFVPPVELSAKLSGCESAFNGLESGRVNVALACGSVHTGDVRILIFPLEARGVAEEMPTRISVENARAFDLHGDPLIIDLGAPASDPVTVRIRPRS